MTKKVINQKGKFNDELINTIEPNFVFENKPINRFNIVKNSNDNNKADKAELLLELKKKINSIENCNLKDNSQNLVLGDGNINSSIMLIGEAPGVEEDKSRTTFKGEAGELLNKMLAQVDTQDIVKIAKDAGKAIMQVYNQNFDVEYKEDNSPLTLADKRSKIGGYPSFLSYKFLNEMLVNN